MPRLLSKLVLSPSARRRAHVIAAVAFGCVAAISWWQVVTEGATSARVLSAVASTVVVVLEVFLPRRRRLLRRRTRLVESDEKPQLPSQSEGP